MPKWGDRTFKGGNQEDEEASRKLMEKLRELDGDEGKETMKPNQIHSMDPAWQVYSSRAFGNEVRRLRKIRSKYLQCLYYYYC